jgi:hypothetical protein
MRYLLAAWNNGGREQAAGVAEAVELTRFAGDGLRLDAADKMGEGAADDAEDEEEEALASMGELMLLRRERPCAGLALLLPMRLGRKRGVSTASA